MKSIYLSVLLLLVISFGLRFYQLDKYPVQLNHDEISQLYDLKSIVETKHDIYGNYFPLAFPSTGDFKPGHYIYLSVIPYLLFGDYEVTIRIAAAFFGSLTPLAVFCLMYQLTKNWKLALITGITIALTPSEIYYSRKSFEGAIATSLSIWGLAFLVKGLIGKASKAISFFGIFLLTLSMYIYTAQTIVAPLIVFATLVTNLGNPLKKIKTVLPYFLWFAVLILPLIYLTAINPDIGFRAKSVFLTQDQVLGESINLTRSFSPIVKLVTSLYLILTTAILRWLDQFDPIYLFANGLNFTNQGPVGVGPLLLFEFPLFLIGLVSLLKNQSYSKIYRWLFILVGISFLPSALTFEKFSPHRSEIGFVLLSIISGFGIWILVTWGKSWIKALSTIFITLALGFNVLSFWMLYTINLPAEKSEHIHYPYKEISEYIWSEYPNYQTIIWDQFYGPVAPVNGVAAQYYLAYYGHIRPSDMQRQLSTYDGGMSFDKFQLRYFNLMEEKKAGKLKNTLIIASPWRIRMDFIDPSQIAKIFYFYNGQIAFYAVKF